MRYRFGRDGLVALAAALPLVPDEALIATGEEARVIVAEGAGRFRPQRVRTGSSSGGMTQILAGLEGGEQVVVSGQFLIDSEASLSGLLQRLPPAAPVDASDVDASEVDASEVDAPGDATDPGAEPRQ